MRDVNVHIFERHARKYDRWFEEHAYTYESEVLAVRSLLPPSGRGLEIGVGTGRFALPLGITVGAEPAHAMASIARQRGIRVYEASADDLPFADESFDFVVMVTAICFFNDPLHALRETSRVLKSSGRIIIGMIDADSPLGKDYKAKQSESTFYRHARFFSVTQVIEWLTGLRFGAIKTCQTIFRNSEEVTALEPIKEGYGEGGFVVIAAQRELKK